MKRLFTLLEVIIALAILTVGMLVLVDTQAIAVLMTTEADNIRIGTLLAEEKMAEVQLLVEQDGFQADDVEDYGDFGEFGDESFRGEDLGDMDIGEDLEWFQWAYTVREVDMSLPEDLTGTASGLIDDGYLGDDISEAYTDAEEESDDMDLGDFGMTSDMITDYLNLYIREIRVLVWWSEEEDEDGNLIDSVELVTHVINPSGVVTSDTGT